MDYPNIKTVRPYVLYTALLFIGAFWFLLYHMCPTVSEGDSGEFITASVRYSIPHAPGYPLYTTLGNIFKNIIPWASCAYRINVLSVACAAGATALLFHALIMMGAPCFGSLIGALSMFASCHFFENALVAEVFALHALCAVLIIWCVSRADQVSIDRMRTYTYLCALIAGLSCANHQTIVFVGPGAALWFFFVWYACARHNYRMVVADGVLCLLFFLTGLTIYGVLPIRSMKNPFLDWSNPETLTNFWRVFTRADYGSFSLTLDEKMSLTPDIAFQQILRYGEALVQEYSIGVLFGCIGFAGCMMKSIKERKFTPAVAGISFIVSSIVFLLMANMPFDAQSTGVMGRFYIMPAVFFSVSIGLFFVWLKNSKLLYGSYFLILVPCIMLYQNQALFGRRNFYVALDYGKNILHSIAPRAVLFMDGGDDTFYTLAYLTRAEQNRQDIVMHDRGGLIFPNPYGKDFRSIKKETKDQRRLDIEISVLRSGKPLYYSTMNMSILPGVLLSHRGLVFEAYLQEQQEKTKNIWPFYRLRGLYPCRWIDHIYRVRALVPIYDYLKGLEEFSRNNIDQSFLYWKRALTTGFDVQWLTRNLGIELVSRGFELFQKGILDTAQKVYTMAIQADPQGYVAYLHLGVIAEKNNDLQTAEKYNYTVLSLEPDCVDAYYNLSVIYWKRGEWDKVVAILRKVLEIKPDHALAQRYLEQALARKSKS